MSFEGIEKKAAVSSSTAEGSITGTDIDGGQYESGEGTQRQE